MSFYDIMSYNNLNSFVSFFDLFVYTLLFPFGVCVFNSLSKFYNVHSEDERCRRVILQHRVWNPSVESLIMR